MGEETVKVFADPFFARYSWVGLGHAVSECHCEGTQFVEWYDVVDHAGAQRLLSGH